MHKKLAKYTNIYQNMFKCIGKLQNMPKYTKTYHNIPRMHINIPKYIKRLKTVKIYQDIPRNQQNTSNTLKKLQNIPKYIQIY